MEKEKYYKRSAESDLGEGIVYLEFSGEWVTRQIEIYGSQWFSSSDKENYDKTDSILCDQPFSEMEDALAPEYKISKEEFEKTWKEAIKKCP